MTSHPKTYTEEYRRESADYALSSGKSNRQIANELGVNYKTFSNWVKKRKLELDGGSAVTVARAAEEKELKRRIKELELENEFLKKAAAFFAKEQ